jgi:hypothetical protein
MNHKINVRITMCVSIFITLLLAIPFSLSAAEDDQAQSSRLSENDSRQAFEHETGFYYTVQKGDTLWDLSQKFSDSPWLWPELWKENVEIANPHRIYPGERIRLYRRKGVHRMAEKKVGKPFTAKPALDSLIHFSYAPLDRVGFIRKEPVAPHGTIFKVRETKEMINTDDVVYIRPEGNFILVPGKRYVIYRTLIPIKDLKTNTYVGIQHYLTGVLEITQVEPQYAIATVIAAYRPIRLDDKLLPYYRRLPQIIIKESPRGLEGKIITAEEHQRLIGDDMIVFIDKGKKDGVRPGQFYNVYFQDEHRIQPKSRQKTMDVPVDFGELLVLHTENTTATVIVTSTEREFEPGTKIRSPSQ